MNESKFIHALLIIQRYTFTSSGVLAMLDKI